MVALHAHHYNHCPRKNVDILRQYSIACTGTRRGDSMSLDVELYRRTVYVPMGGSREKKFRRISVLDIQPEDATHTLVFVHGYGGSALQWLYQLRFFGQTMRVVAPDLRGHGLSGQVPLAKAEGLASTPEGVTPKA